MNQGNSQRFIDAVSLIKKMGIYDFLNEYHPEFVGTIPLDVDTEKSDIDIICFSTDLLAFQHLVKSKYGKEQCFKQKMWEINRTPTAMTTFFAENFEWELFVQPIETTKQMAYLHMQAEARMLFICGNSLRTVVRTLKESGEKTEPAFAKALGLSGNPYKAVLETLKEKPETLKLWWSTMQNKENKCGQFNKNANDSHQ